MANLLNFFSKMAKGDAGENEVLESITQLLRNSDNQNNFFLLQKVKIPDMTKTLEIDLLLLHPTLGIYVIEVKNWESLKLINEENNPFDQVSNYKNLLLSFLKEKMGKIPMNIESRIVFPSISKNEADEFFKENHYYKNYSSHTFFQNDLESKSLFKDFFNSSSNIIPNKKEFMAVASYLMDKDTIKKSQDRIVPIITKDEILFFDHKQLSILNGYSGDFRIIRGVAGTGKTIILTNFIQNKLEIDTQNKFLILCFNKQLADNITDSFDEKYRKNVASYSLFALLKRIKFDDEKIGITKQTSFDERFKLIKSSKGTQEFQKKFQTHLKTHPIDYFLCDETQDMPANIMRIIYEEIKDCIFFIDEAQKFYSYSMDSVAEIFHHKDFEKINMSGRVKNLKNVYRTPSNIAKCAFEILSLDNNINSYYKKSFYIKNGFLDDIKFILEDGSIKTGEWDSFENIKKLIDTLDEETVILTQYKESKYNNSVSVESLNRYLISIDKNHLIKAMTFQSIKGLEAKNIVLHNFDRFLMTTAKYDSDIIYRKIYVLFTRALENLYISIENESKLIKNKDINNILKVLKEHQKYIKKKEEEVKVETKTSTEKEKFNLAKLKPKISNVKETGEIVIVASELFAIVAGLFA
jgi:hypothetical protein